MTGIRLKRVFIWLGWEVVGLGLLVAFVLLLATMPPLQITKSPAATLGYRVRVSYTRWQINIDKYKTTIKSGSLGKDRNGTPVAPMLRARLGASLKLMGLGLFLAVVLGIVKGIWDFKQARRGKGAVGPLITGIAQGLPDFWLVMILQIGVVWLYRQSGLRPVPVAWDDANTIGSMVLPVICVAMLPWAYTARITSQAMLTVYEQDFIRTARAKGLTERTVVYKHALVSAVVTILDGLPNAMAVMFSSMLIVEVLCNYPGVTALLRDAIRPGFGQLDVRFGVPTPDVAVLVPTAVALGIIFSLLYSSILLLRRVADPRLRERE